MIFPAWTRLVNFYSEEIAKLLARSAKEEPWERVANSPAFRKEARRVAESMAVNVASVNAKSWRSAAYKSSKGQKIYDALRKELERKNLSPYLREIAQRNADWIESVPMKIAERITARSAELHQLGRRPEEIEGEIRKMAPDLTRSHAHLIARTEISRAETDLTRARAVSIGVPAYEWHTSEDSRVRPSHRKMDGVLVLWGDPPDPERLFGERSSGGKYHAGCIYNCRCVSLPLVSLEEVSWPARLYRAGSIRRVTKAQFVGLTGYSEAA